MSRWINAEHLKRWLVTRWEEIDPKSENPLKIVDIFNQIDYGELSIDIVRCKECNNYFYDKLNDAWFCRIHEYGEEFKPDDYCSYGERRE